MRQSANCKGDRRSRRYGYKTYAKAFRPGSGEGLETFRELYRKVFTLANEHSTILFITP